MMTPSTGRQPQNIKSWIYQRPDIGSSSNFLNLTRTGKCLKWRRPPIEDELKLLKVGYVRNYRVDIPRIPQMEEDLKISKFEYL